MPSSPNYVRDYKQERRTAKKRGETGVGSKSGDATRHRDRRAYEKKNGKIPKDKELHHTKKRAKGKTRVISKKSNRSKGGSYKTKGKAQTRGDRPRR